MSASTANQSDTHTPVNAAAAPLVTWTVLLICLGVHFGVLREAGTATALAKYGYLPASEIWDGAVWVLLSSVFVHLDLVHLLFSAYWIWALGGRLEQQLGTGPYLAFFAVTGIVTSTLQLAFAGETGMGASGVVYAMFGYMLVARDRSLAFRQVLNKQTIIFFVVWLFLGLAITEFGFLNFDNASHFAGLMFGALISLAYALCRQPKLIKGLLGLCVAASLVTLWWCPWSPAWSSHKAYKAHSAGDYHKAIVYYTKVLEADWENAWAYENRALAHWLLGEYDQAAKDNKEARRINPAVPILDLPEVGLSSF